MGESVTSPVVSFVLTGSTRVSVETDKVGRILRPQLRQQKLILTSSKDLGPAETDAAVFVCHISLSLSLSGHQFLFKCLMSRACSLMISLVHMKLRSCSFLTGSVDFDHVLQARRTNVFMFD